MAQPQLPQSKPGKTKRHKQSNNENDSMLCDPANPSSSATALHSLAADLELVTMKEEEHDCESPKTSRLLSLPDELLLNVASQLCGNNAILGLSRVDKHMHAVVIEAMAKDLHVHECQLNKAIEWLVDHEDFIQSVITVDLTTSWKKHIKGCSIREFPPCQAAMASLRSATLRYSVMKEDWQLVKQLRYTRREPDDQSVISTLFALCPNIKAIKMLMPDVVPFNIPTMAPPGPLPHQLPMENPDFHPITPLAGVALHALRDKLRSLTIVPRRIFDSPSKSEILETRSSIQLRQFGNNPLTFQGLDKLEYLDVWMDMLGLPLNIQCQDADAEPITDTPIRLTALVNGVATSLSIPVRTKFLPASLVHLQLRSCNKYTISMLWQICSLAKYALKIKKIDLHLSMNARDSIVQWMNLCDKFRSVFPTVLAEAQKQGIQIQFHKDDTIVPMRTELALYLALTDDEAAVVALAGRQFSEVRGTAIHRRKQSPLEHQLFMRHGVTYFDLYNSRTFDARFWKDVAFFHGAKNTKFDPDLAKYVPVETKIRDDTKPFPSRRKKGLFLVENAGWKI
jgi:hypothetical protein